MKHPGAGRCCPFLGGQHPSPDVKNPLPNSSRKAWLEIITSRDAKSACFQGSQTSCTEIISGGVFAKIWPKKITSRNGCVLLIFDNSAPAVYKIQGP